MLKELCEAVDSRRKERKLNTRITRVLSIPRKRERRSDKGARKVWYNTNKTIRV